MAVSVESPNERIQQQRIEWMLKPTSQVTRSGDTEARNLALRQLFDQEETALLRYAFSYVGRREVAEEIVQEVFLQLHTRWDEVETPKAWLFRTVRNRAFNFVRDHPRGKRKGAKILLHKYHMTI